MVKNTNQSEKQSRAQITDSALSLLESLKDNTPMKGFRGFGRGQTQSYYYKQTPNKEDYYFVAKDDPVAYRLVYEFPEAVWNNRFRIRFKDLDVNLAVEKEDLILKYLDKILFWENARKWNQYDREQGESILLKHFAEDTADELLWLPAPKNGEVIRVEAFNFVDYEIHQVKEYGDIQYCSIKQYRENNVIKYTRIHPSRFIRMKLRNIDYDPYNGQSILRSIFSDLMILSHIMLAIGDAAFRWGMGIPAIWTKKITNSTERTRLKNALSKINNQAFLMIPEEIVSKIEYLSNNMTNLSIEGLVKPLIDRIIIATGYPRNILMGEQLGIIRGGEVNQKEFMAIIDKEQTLLEHYVKKFFLEDPYILSIIGETVFDIDWGLRRVMTEMDQAELNAKLYDNAIKLKELGLPFNEVLKACKMPRFESLMEDDEKLYEKMFQLTTTEIGLLPCNFVNEFVFGYGALQYGNNGENEDPNNKTPGIIPSGGTPPKVGNLVPETGISENEPVSANPVTDEFIIPNEKQALKDFEIALDGLRDVFGTPQKAMKVLDSNKDVFYNLINACKREQKIR